jgi:ATP-binding cassette, subfamily A (ABC1), member 3
MPMKTPEYEAVEPLAVDALSQNFPFFFMFTFLIPLYYIVSKLAEEKESKSREGMKMMGLKDDSYFLSWFVFHLILIIVMATLITLMVSINVFTNSSKVLIFLLAFFYGLSLFGFSICIVSIFPNVRGAATAATLLHLITYFAVFALRDPDLPAALKTVMSIFPNVGMSFCIYNLYQFEANSTGLSFDNFNIWYNNTTYFYSLLMLVIDFVFYTCLGLYLDQILQSQFGVAKKWYFLCTRKFWCSGKKKGKNMT